MSTRRALLTILAAGAVMLALGSGPVQATPPPPGIQASARWFTDYVDDDGDVGEYAAIAFDPGTGTPWISYYDATNTALKVAHYVGTAGNCGEAQWNCATVDGLGGLDMGKFASIYVPENANYEPHIAYYDATNGRLRYAVLLGGGEGNCGPGNSFQCDDIEYIGTGLTQAGISLALDSYNHPIIAYMGAHVTTGRDLGVAQPASVLGLPYSNCGPTPDLFGTWQCTTVDDSGYTINATYASIAFDPETDLAMIAYSAYPILGTAIS